MPRPRLHPLARTLVAPLIGLLLAMFGHQAPARACQLTTGGQLGASLSVRPVGGVSNESWTVWGSRTDGHLVSMYTQPTGSFIWADEGTMTFLGTVHAQGVSATGWQDGVFDTFERAYFVGAGDGKLYARAIDGTTGATGWGSINPPGANICPGTPAQVLTGHIAATNTEDAATGDHWVRVYASTTTGRLYVYSRNITTVGAGTWSCLENGNVSTTSPLAAVTSVDETTTRVFATLNANTVIMWSKSGAAAWARSVIGAPAGIPVCGTAAAVDDPTLGWELFCSRKGAANGNIYRARSNGVGGFAWFAHAVGANVVNTNYAMGARRGFDGIWGRFDVYVLAGAAGAQSLHHLRHAVVDPAIIVESLGADGETTQALGGLAAILRPPDDFGDYSVVFGGQVDTAGNVRRLYERSGNGLAPAGDPWTWMNHQIGCGPGLVTTTPAAHAEVSMALFKGRGVAAAIRRTGAGPSDFAHVDAVWSRHDGEPWQAPIEILEPFPSQVDYVTDPTVDFSDDPAPNGTAYIAALGIDFVPNVCAIPNIAQAYVYYVSTTDGLAFSDPAAGIVVQASNIDHPWMAIERRTGPDVLHFVWFDVNASQVRYRNLSGGILGPIIGISAVGDADPPMLSVGASGAVYIAWGNHICRLDGSGTARTGCFGLKVFAVGDPLEEQRATPAIPGTAETLRSGAGVIIYASAQDPNVVYRIFENTEDAAPFTQDVWFTRGLYDDAGTPGDPNDDPMMTFTARAAVGPTNDGVDQFGPAVTTSRDVNSGEHVFVSWYDRNGTICTPNNHTNRCWKGMRSVSFNQGLSFLFPQQVDDTLPGPVLSDPAVLPQNCTSPTIRFHGDFHSVRGDLLHSMHVVTTAPVGSPTPTAYLTEGWVSGGYYYWEGVQ